MKMIDPGYAANKFWQLLFSDMHKFCESTQIEDCPF